MGEIIEGEIVTETIATEEITDESVAMVQAILRAMNPNY